MSAYDDVVNLCRTIVNAVDVKDAQGNVSRGPIEKVRAQPEDANGMPFLSGSEVLTIPWDHLPAAVADTYITFTDTNGTVRRARVRERTDEDGDGLLHNLWLS